MTRVQLALWKIAAKEDEKDKKKSGGSYGKSMSDEEYNALFEDAGASVPVKNPSAMAQGAPPAVGAPGAGTDGGGEIPIDPNTGKPLEETWWHGTKRRLGDAPWEVHTTGGVLSGLVGLHELNPKNKFPIFNFWRQRFGLLDPKLARSGLDAAMKPGGMSADGVPLVSAQELRALRQQKVTYADLARARAIVDGTPAPTTSADPRVTRFGNVQVTERFRVPQQQGGRRGRRAKSGKTKTTTPPQPERYQTEVTLAEAKAPGRARTILTNSAAAGADLATILSPYLATRLTYALFPQIERQLGHWQRSRQAGKAEASRKVNGDRLPVDASSRFADPRK